MTDHQIAPRPEAITLERQLQERTLLAVLDPNQAAEAAAAEMGLGNVAYGPMALAIARALVLGYDEAQRRATARLTKLQACQEIINDQAAGQDLKRRARASMDALLDRRDKDLQLVDRRELEVALEASTRQNIAAAEVWRERDQLRKDLTKARDELEQVRAQLAAAGDKVKELRELVSLHRDACGKAEAQLARAKRALERARYTDDGAAEWKPPVDTVAGDLQRQVFDLQDQLAERGHRIGDMRILLMRASRQLHLAAPENQLPAKVTEYLKRYNLIGSPLRNGDSELETYTVHDLPYIPGVDIDAVHRAHADAIATGTGILLTSTEGIEHVDPFTILLHPDPAKEWDQALRGENQAGIVDTEGKPIVYDLTLQGFTKGEATTEPAPEIVSIATGEPSTDPAVVTIPYEGPERRGVHIPGAIWPDPAKSKFSLKDDSSPMNPGNRHAPLKRRHDD